MIKTLILQLELVTSSDVILMNRNSTYCNCWFGNLKKTVQVSS